MRVLRTYEPAYVNAMTVNCHRNTRAALGRPGGTGTSMALRSPRPRTSLSRPPRKVPEPDQSVRPRETRHHKCASPVYYEASQG